MSLPNANVGLFCDCFPPVMDGVSVCMANYARWMQEKVGGVKVITPNVPGTDYGKYDFSVLDYFSIPVPMRRPYVTGIAEIDPFFLARVSRVRFRILHTHCPFTSGYAAQHIAKSQGIPVIGTFHSKYRDDFARLFPKTITNGIIKSIISFYERCDQVWVPQDSVIDVIREYGYRGNVEVVDNGSDLAAVYDDNFFADARRSLGLSRNDFVLLFVGQHIWEKNPRFIIDALANLPDIPFRMFFIGNGYASDAMKELVSDYGLDSKVTFVGTVHDREVLKRYYAASDLFIFPSMYDNAPLVVREAAALGTPSVMLQGSTASSIIEDGVNGFITENNPVALASLLLSLKDDGERIRRVGKTASSTIVRSWEDVVDEVLWRYNSLLKSKKLPLIEKIS